MTSEGPNDSRKRPLLGEGLKALWEAEPEAEVLRVVASQGIRSYSRRELFERAQALAGGLLTRSQGQFTHCLILAETRPEWVIIDLACVLAGFVSVPLFPNVEPETLARVLSATGCRLAIVENPWQALKLEDARARLARAGVEVVLDVILIDEALELSSGAKATLEEVGGRAVSIDTISRGFAPTPRIGATPDGVVTLCYTPGTEGSEKGVIWTHGSGQGLVASLGPALEGLEQRARDKRDKGPRVLFLAVPLAQALGRAVMWCVLERGWVLALPRSEARNLDDVVVLEPTVVVGVPSFFARARFAAGVELKARGAVSALASRRMERPRAQAGLGRLVDGAAARLMRPALARCFGPRARVFLSGGAPLREGVQDVFLRCGLMLRECYGLVETTAVTHLDVGDVPRAGSVGVPLPGVEQRLGDDGELMVRGPQVGPGYWNDLEATARVFEGGWFSTGDLAAQVDGQLVITGRKRDIVVLANGRTLAPRPIERRLMADPLIAQALVHGDRRDFVSLLVALSSDELSSFAARHGLDMSDIDTVVRHTRIYAHLEALVDSVNSSLPPHARIKKFAVLTHELVPGAGLTPTGTVNRKLAERHHQALLDSFYAESF